MSGSTSFSTKESEQKSAQNAGNDATATFDTMLLNEVMRTMRDSLDKSVDNFTATMVSGYALSELELALNAEYHRLKKVLKKQFHPSPEARKELIARFDSECGMLRSTMVKKYLSVRQSSLDWAVSRAVNAIDHELHEVDVDTLVPSPTLANALEEQISNKARAVKHSIIQSVAGWLLSEQDKQDDQDSDETNPEVAAQLLQENQFHVSLFESTADRASVFHATLSAAVSAREDNLVAGPAVTISASSAAEQRARAADWAAANLASKDNKAKRTNRREATPPRKSVPQQRADAVAFAKSNYGEEAVALTPPAFYFKRKPMTEESANKLNEAKDEVRRQAAERRSAAAIAAAERAAKTKASLRSSAPQPAPPTAEPQISNSTSESKFIDDCGKREEETPVGQELQARRRLKVPAKTRNKRASSSDVLPLPPFANASSKPALHAPINEPVSAPVVPGEGESLPSVDVFLLEKLLSGLHTSPSSSSSSSAEGPASLDSCLARTSNLKGVSWKMEPAPPLPPSHESVAHVVCDPTLDCEAVDSTFSDEEEEDEVDTPNRPMAAFMPNFAPQVSVNNATEAARVTEKGSEERIRDKIDAEKRAVLEKERQLQEKLEREAQRLQDIADRIAAEMRAEQEKERRLAEKRSAEIRAEEEEEEEEEEEAAAVRGSEEAARREVQDTIDAELVAKQAIEEEKIRAVQRKREAAEAAVREAQEAEERAIAEAAAEAARLEAEEEERIKNEREEKERQEKQKEQEKEGEQEEAHLEALRSGVEQAAAEEKTIGETGQSDRSPQEEVRAPCDASTPSHPKGPHDHTHGRAESESVTQDAVSPKSVRLMEDDACDPVAEEGSKPVKRRSWFKSIFRWKSKKEKKSKP